MLTSINLTRTLKNSCFTSRIAFDVAIYHAISSKIGVLSRPYALACARSKNFCVPPFAASRAAIESLLSVCRVSSAWFETSQERNESLKSLASSALMLLEKSEKVNRSALREA